MKKMLIWSFGWEVSLEMLMIFGDIWWKLMDFWRCNWNWGCSCRSFGTRKDWCDHRPSNSLGPKFQPKKIGDDVTKIQWCRLTSEMDVFLWKKDVVGKFLGWNDLVEGRALVAEAERYGTRAPETVAVLGFLGRLHFSFISASFLFWCLKLRPHNATECALWVADSQSHRRAFGNTGRAISRSDQKPSKSIQKWPPFRSPFHSVLKLANNLWMLTTAWGLQADSWFLLRWQTTNLQMQRCDTESEENDRKRLSGEKMRKGNTKQLEATRLNNLLGHRGGPLRAGSFQRHPQRCDLNFEFSWIFLDLCDLTFEPSADDCFMPFVFGGLRSLGFFLCRLLVWVHSLREIN